MALALVEIEIADIVNRFMQEALLQKHGIKAGQFKSTDEGRTFALCTQGCLVTSLLFNIEELSQGELSYV